MICLTLLSNTNQNKMSKLKVLHLFNTYLPQTENWAYNLMTALPDCEIHIGAKKYLKNNFYNPQFHFADNLSGSFEQMDKQLQKNNFSNRLKKIVLRSMPFLFDNLDNNLIDYGKKEKIQIVHAHFADIGWHFKEVAKQLHVPFVVSFYGWDYEKLPHVKPEFKSRFKKLFKVVDQFICEGTHGASILVEHGCPESKITIVPLGIQPDQIEFLPRTKVPNQLKLVQIASFTEKKGHQYAIEAVASILKNCPNIELTFIGNYNELKRREKLELQVSELGLTKQVHFLPAIDYEQLYATLGAYDVFIHPSCYAADRDCEGGAPVVLLDAQATGMPIISTTHCDIPDEVIHQKTGLLSTEKEVEALAQNIKRFYEMDNKEYQEFANHANAHVKKEYSIAKNALLLKAAYDKII